MSAAEPQNRFIVHTERLRTKSEYARTNCFFCELTKEALVITHCELRLEFSEGFDSNTNNDKKGGTAESKGTRKRLSNTLDRRLSLSNLAGGPTVKYLTAENPLKDMLYYQIKVRDNDSDSPQWKENIDQLRAKIDIIDENILYALGSRMKVSRKIGEYKRDNNIAILQTSRWDAVLAKVVEKGQEYGLTENFLKDVFTAIHEASVEIQNDIISKTDQDSL